GELVRFAEAEEVGGEDPVAAARERRDHLAVQERPARLAVEAEDRLAASLVQVMHAGAADRQVVRREGVPGEVAEALVRRPEDRHGRMVRPSVQSGAARASAVSAAPATIAWRWTRRAWRRSASRSAASPTASSPASMLRAPRAASATHVRARAWARPRAPNQNGRTSATRQARGTPRAMSAARPPPATR